MDGRRERGGWEDDGGRGLRGQNTKAESTGSTCPDTATYQIGIDFPIGWRRAGLRIPSHLPLVASLVDNALPHASTSAQELLTPSSSSPALTASATDQKRDIHVSPYDKPRALRDKRHQGRTSLGVLRLPALEDQRRTVGRVETLFPVLGRGEQE
ncbi:hypothetical protein BDN72DRAFT_895942 [Pluteus cervinus]|uniref:Uncharacterized protein n=1 Tax=Pluteus cervinus TaxID=181527 RepID=A0ACD3AZH8_9AGAR|nr:hypothetical protein BDN72DRAFT_895942 [Pluteus cervinus]